MKRQRFLTASFVTALFAVLLAPMLWAQKPAGTTGPKYDLTTETKLKGTVEEVKLVPGSAEGTHLLVKSGAGVMLVHVAPEKFLQELEVAFKTGDQVQVMGSKLKIDGVDEVLAREIAIGANTLILRDRKGTPVWQGWEPEKR
ncbi:MAG TPA: hypothetical protein VN622_16770 [Clostridia bacterium]|nr:hypothetical protein [Clostridia bacterium]